MRQVLQYPKRGGLTVADCPHPGLKPGGIVVENHCSLISPGTERAIIDLAEKSLVNKARSRPDLVRQVIDKARREGLASTLAKVQSRLKAPIPLGYSAAGRVVEVAPDVHEFSVGDRVACAGFGYACHAERVFVPHNLAVMLPPKLGFDEGAFVTLGAIALWGVRQAQVSVGERVAVIGLGLLGQLTQQILSAAGCQVIVIDLDQQRLDEAARFAPALLVNAADPTAAEAVKQFTGGSGVDAVIITAATKSNEPILLAATIARDRGRVVIVGDVKMEIPRKPFYEKELTLTMSRSYGPGRYDPTYEERGVDYPIGQVRWTENRNMRAFLDLVAAGKVDVKSLVTAEYRIDEAATAFERMEAEKVLGLLLRYAPEEEAESTAREKRAFAPTSGKIRVGFLGAGIFASGVLLPALMRNAQCERSLLYSATPYRARAAAEQFKFAATADSEEELLTDSTIDAVIIATPHNCHARQTMRALEAGKHVLVEKPMCLTLDELEAIKAAQAASGCAVMVGFNRRYAAASKALAAALSGRAAPAIVNYTVNAGFIDKDNWVHDDTIGGGRIIGEGCHFIDLICHLLQARVRTVRAVAIAATKGRYQADDNVQLQLEMSDGSIAAITYTAMGAPSFSKETLQIICDGTALRLTDFKLVEHFREGGTRRLYKGSMDKGFDSELTAFFTVIRDGQSQENLESFYHAMRATLQARRALSLGSAIAVD